jgi:hypothetical protein
MPLFAGASRDELRRVYLDAWTRDRAAMPLTPVQAQVAAVIREHPEYHGWLERGEAALSEEFTPARGLPNPFLHLGMHLALREQVATDRPAGIRAAAERLAVRSGSRHEAEHAMMEALGATLWEAQRSGAAPDERVYLERILRLSGTP